MSRDDLQRLKLDAAYSYTNGNFHTAEYKFRDSLSGFRHLGGSTDKCTLRTAYQLASLYAKLSRMEDANRVLQWALESHVDKWTMDHPRTIAHKMQVVELYHSWSMGKSAVALIGNLFEALDQYSEKTGTHTIVVDDEGDTYSEQDSRNGDGDSGDDVRTNDQIETRVDSQLHLDGVWLDFHTPTMEHLLSRLIVQCEKHPKDLATHSLKARFMLLKFHEKMHQPGTALTVAKEALQTLLRIMSEQEGPPPVKVLQIAQELAFFYLEHGSPDKCERILCWLAGKLERENPGGDHFRVDLAQSALSFIIMVACKHQQRDGGGWRDASPWFERAYSLVIGLGDPGGSLARTVEKTIKSRGANIGDYQMAQRG